MDESYSAPLEPSVEVDASLDEYVDPPVSSLGPPFAQPSGASRTAVTHSGQASHERRASRDAIGFIGVTRFRSTVVIAS
jgi:hypothetical protein